MPAVKGTWFYSQQDVFERVVGSSWPFWAKSPLVCVKIEYRNKNRNVKEPDENTYTHA